MRLRNACRSGWLCCLSVLPILASPTTAQRRGGGEGCELGLFGSLPIYWGEATELPSLIAGAEPPGWVRQELERRYHLRLLDVLGPSQGADTLAGIHSLLLAQPRALSGVENVALDDWVRDGGRLLLFADPILTAHSDFGLGDRRRPKDVALISPILAHWGLELRFDEDQPGSEQQVQLFDLAYPVAFAGHFVRIESAGESAAADTRCELHAGGLAAQCAIGKGRVLLIADAALLDNARGGAVADRQALAAVLDLAFAAPR